MQLDFQTVKKAIGNEALFEKSEIEIQRRKAASHADIPEFLKEVASYVFEQITTMRTAWKVPFTNEDRSLDRGRITSYKIQLLRAMESENINTFEKVELGLSKLRAERGQFLPSIGDFICACKEQPAKRPSYHRAKRLTAQERKELQELAIEQVKKAKALIVKNN